MDKNLINKVKQLLTKCTPNNADQIKTQLMVTLKPEEANQVYDYFLREEPDFIYKNYKVWDNQVIPQYNDYFTDNSTLSDIVDDDDYVD